jgi:hypothetical protein
MLTIPVGSALASGGAWQAAALAKAVPGPAVGIRYRSAAGTAEGIARTVVRCLDHEAVLCRLHPEDIHVVPMPYRRPVTSPEDMDRLAVAVCTSSTDAVEHVEGIAAGPYQDMLVRRELKRTKRRDVMLNYRGVGSRPGRGRPCRRRRLYGVRGACRRATGSEEQQTRDDDGEMRSPWESPRYVVYSHILPSLCATSGPRVRSHREVTKGGVFSARSADTRFSP